MKGLCSVLSFALTVYLGVALLLFVFQRSVLYYPDSQRPSKAILDSKNLRFWPSPDDYRGLIAGRELPDARGASKGTIVVFHGNAGSAYHRDYYIDALLKQNFRVVLAEYPGYGGRSGSPNEENLVDDAAETLEIAYKRYGAPLYLWGESLGAGVVAGVVSKTEVPVKALVLFTPWDSLPELAQTHYWYLPARWMVRDRFDNVGNLESYEGNVAVVLAEFDEVIPVPHGKKLYQTLNSNKKLWHFKGVKHNTIPVSPDLSWWEEVGDFISQ